MKRKLPPALSASEQAIMDQLWRGAPVSLNDLLDAVNAGREEPISRATLQTQLTRLETKGWVLRDDSNRAHVYEPAVAETRGRQSVLSELKRRFFGGSSMALMRCLVESGDISKDEMQELRRLIDSAEPGGAPKP
jgi:BlaI family penicillinase repressor